MNFVNTELHCLSARERTRERTDRDEQRRTERRTDRDMNERTYITGTQYNALQAEGRRLSCEYDRFPVKQAGT